MIESNIMVMTKLWISAVVIMFMVSIALFLFELQQINNFKQYINYEIKRNGGLTTEAVERIKLY